MNPHKDQSTQNEKEEEKDLDSSKEQDEPPQEEHKFKEWLQALKSKSADQGIESGEESHRFKEWLQELKNKGNVQGEGQEEEHHRFKEWLQELKNKNVAEETEQGEDRHKFKEWVEEQRRKRMQLKLQQEWSDMEVHLPFLHFSLLVAYQDILPGIPPTLLFIGYLSLWHALPELTWLMILLMPGIFIAIVILYIFLLVACTKVFIDYWNKISPPEEGIFDRKFTKSNVADVRIQYYHLRGFFVKYPVFFTKRSIFPWLVHWVLIKLGHNKIHPDAMYCDCFPSLEMTELEEGAVVSDGTVIGSHIVDSIFGRLTIMANKCEKNAVMHINSVIAPGAKLAENVSLMPFSLAIKGQKGEKSQQFLMGTPAKQKEYQGIAELAAKKFSSRNISENKF
jgi:hypothetical protein